MTRLSAFIRDHRASSAAEFALVLPVLLFFLIGMIDVGRLMWTWNRAEKATQMGVRYAIVTDMVSTGLASATFVNGSVAAGDPIPRSAFVGASCTFVKSTAPGSLPDSGTASCNCTGTGCPNSLQPSADAFKNIVARMRLFLPEIALTNVKIDYRYSGLGYAGDPTGPSVSPIVVVSLQNMTFTPKLAMLFGGNITLPSFSAALTMEDGKGTQSN